MGQVFHQPLQRWVSKHTVAALNYRSSLFFLARVCKVPGADRVGLRSPSLLWPPETSETQAALPPSSVLWG